MSTKTTKKAKIASEAQVVSAPANEIDRLELDLINAKIIAKQFKSTALFVSVDKEANKATISMWGNITRLRKEVKGYTELLAEINGILESDKATLKNDFNKVFDASTTAFKESIRTKYMNAINAIKEDIAHVGKLSKEWETIKENALAIKEDAKYASENALAIAAQASR